MSLESFADLGEALGGLAVVISLIFVGFEVRRARAAYQVAQLKQQVARTIELGRDVRGNVDVWTRGHRNYAGLPIEDQVAFSALMYSVMLDLSEQWVLYTSGRVDDDMWDIVNQNLRFFLSSPGAQQWWRVQPLGLHRDFVAFVEREILPEDGGGPSRS